MNNFSWISVFFNYFKIKCLDSTIGIISDIDMRFILLTLYAFYLYKMEEQSKIKPKHGSGEITLSCIGDLFEIPEFATFGA